MVQRGGVYLAVIMLLVLSGLLSPASVTLSHLLEVAHVASFLGIAAVGEMLVIIVVPPAVYARSAPAPRAVAR